MRLRLLCLLISLSTGAAAAVPHCENRFDGPPNFFVHSLRLTGLQSLHAEERLQIKKSILLRCFDNAEVLSKIIHDILQRHGFFKAVISEPELKVREPAQWPGAVDVSANVDLGRKYRLANLIFVNASAFPAAQLRKLMPIRAGDVFNAEKIREGLEALREFYGEHGYINFTPVPNTEFDESRSTIRLTIDVDEGSQFTVAKVLMLAPQNIAHRLYKTWSLKPGAVYNRREINRWARENSALLPKGWSIDRFSEVLQDVHNNTVTIRVSLCPPDLWCPQAFSNE